jgi:hypothetical protein
MKTYNIKSRVRCVDHMINPFSHTVRVTFSGCYPSFVRVLKTWTARTPEGALDTENYSYQTAPSNKGWATSVNLGVKTHKNGRTLPVDGYWRDVNEDYFKVVQFIGFYPQLVRFSDRKVRDRFEYLLSIGCRTEVNYDLYSYIFGASNGPIQVRNEQSIRLPKGKRTPFEAGGRISLEERDGSRLLDCEDFIVQHWYETNSSRPYFGIALMSELRSNELSRILKI